MIDVLRIAHLRIAPQEGNLEVGNCEGNLMAMMITLEPFGKQSACQRCLHCNHSYLCLAKVAFQHKDATTEQH